MDDKTLFQTPDACLIESCQPRGWSDLSKVADESEPRALAARYDSETGRIVVDLKNRTTFIFPAEMGEGLAGASPEELEEVEVTPSGSGLHWERLDVDLYVPSLLVGVFGIKAWRRELTRKMGRSKSEAKAAAARANGQRGGRPRKKA